MDPIPMGTSEMRNGRRYVHYYGYWIKAYDPPENTLEEKKRLIEALTRRLFNHVEHGVNVPGERLAEARAAYDGETVPERRRVKAAMLAGALFNRATDMFQKLVEIQALGVEIRPDNALLRYCGEHLQEALVLGKCVLHRTGEEGIDELWGEPFKAFAFPISAFYESRYVKIAQTMAGIDRIAAELTASLSRHAAFDGVAPFIADFAAAAKAKVETLRTDDDIFDIWTSFVVASERLTAFAPRATEGASAPDGELVARGKDLIRKATELVLSVTRARVAMPKSTAALVERCQAFGAAAAVRGTEPGTAVQPSMPSQLST